MTRADPRPSRPVRPCTARAVVATVLAAVLAALVPGLAATLAPPASAADSDRLAVTIDALSPASLTPGQPLTLSGRISNPSSEAWSRLRVHLVMPATPLTDPAAIDAALAAPTPDVTGTRLTSPSAVVAAGDLQPGDTTTFQLEVPAAELPTSASGVYPVGVQVLATGEDGERSSDAIGRSHTVVPYVTDKTTPSARVSVVWPFIAPIQRDERNRYADTSALVQSVSPGGRLRRLLDLARSDESSPSTVLIDPALLDALRDIANDSYGPARTNAPGDASQYPPEELPTEESDAAVRVRTFLTELVDYARRHGVWAVPYGRPDTFAITRGSAGEPGATLVDAAQRATAATLAQFGLTARIAYWPPNGISNAKRLDGSRQLGSTVALLSPEVLAGWTPADSTALRAQAGGAPADVVVVDPMLTSDSGAANATLAMRQRVAARAALGVLGSSSRQVVVVPSPTFDPGNEWARASFHEVFDAPWVFPTAADALVSDRAQAWPGRVALSKGTSPRAISRAQVLAAARIVDSGAVVGALLGDDEQRDVFYAQSASLAISQDWRAARTRGARHAEEQAESVERILDRVSVSPTSFVTLSGSSGRFPVTITNDLPAPVTVGVHFTSDDEDARIDDIPPQQITAGQSVTVTVTADVGQATTTTFRASLITADGTSVGDATPFTVRSSVVGRVIWIFLGLALALVVVAVVRRVVKGRKTSAEAPSDGADPGDDSASAADPADVPAGSTPPVESSSGSERDS